MIAKRPSFCWIHKISRTGANGSKVLSFLDWLKNIWLNMGEVLTCHSQLVSALHDNFSKLITFPGTLGVAYPH